MNYSPLLEMMWRSGHFTGRDLVGACGEEVTIVSEGERGPDEGIWSAAEIIVDGERRRGTVAIGEETPAPDETCLRMVAGYTPLVLGANDRLVTQIGYHIEPEITECYDGLRAGAGSFGCAGRISGMNSLRRTELFTGLLVERLRRKYGEVMRIFKASDEDWNQAFYTMLLRVMGGDRNRETYMSLASKVPSAILSREKGSTQKLEALLLGTGGFLFAAESVKDDYTLRLEEEFRHLANKYGIVPLKPAGWDTANVRTSNFPTLRLVEIAALFAKKDFMLDGMLACRTPGDVENLFGVQASEYWNTHCKPSVYHGLSPKRIGKVKTALIGINLVAPLMFAYGKETGEERLCERALDLLNALPAEKNRKIEGWYQGGCAPENGFESQALLQLTNEYCEKGACTLCRIGRTEIKKVMNSLISTINA